MKSFVAQVNLFWMVVTLRLPSIISAFSIKVEGLRVDKTSLHPKDPSSAYSFVLSSAMDIMGHSQHSHVNFLATQVWPSARVAALQIELYASTDDIKSFCELGCGPGLPSITAARMGIPHIWATDIDEFALSLVRSAANEQGLADAVRTQKVDLIVAEEGDLPEADLYVLSDVFESAAVARGAARVCEMLLRRERTVWVFAQSDRVQREVFLVEMKLRLGDDEMEWSPVAKGPRLATEPQPNLFG